jgi:hypothetical protein
VATKLNTCGLKCKEEVNNQFKQGNKLGGLNVYIGKTHLIKRKNTHTHTQNSFIVCVVCVCVFLIWKEQGGSICSRNELA